ncbi:Unknown protein, partial [Striga hermonthica]
YLLYLLYCSVRSRLPKNNTYEKYFQRRKVGTQPGYYIEYNSYYHVRGMYIIYKLLVEAPSCLSKYPSELSLSSQDWVLWEATPRMCSLENRPVTGNWPDDALVGAFIGGLKFDRATEVRLERPDTMHMAMEVARRREDHLAVTRRGRADVRFTDTRRAGPSQSTAGARPTIIARSAGPVVKRLSAEEFKRRREKGICFKCEEKFTPGHQ